SRNPKQSAYLRIGDVPSSTIGDIRMRFLASAATALIGWSLACSAWAWADRPLKLIVPAPPGGTMDIVARVVGQQLSIDIDRPVVVENRPGAARGAPALVFDA